MVVGQGKGRGSRGGGKMAGGGNSRGADVHKCLGSMAATHSPLPSLKRCGDRGRARAGGWLKGQERGRECVSLDYEPFPPSFTRNRLCPLPSFLPAQTSFRRAFAGGPGL